MQLADVLKTTGLELQTVAVVLHSSRLQPLRRMFPALAYERPDLFEAYQSVHAARAASTLYKRRFFTSFIPLSEGTMLFVGLFEIVSVSEKLTTEIYCDRRFRELELDYGATDTAPSINTARFETQLHFETALTDHLTDLRFRLKIGVPVGRTYVRLAENLNAPILELAPEAITAPPAPDWETFVVPPGTMKTLPKSWREKLQHWRGVYLIIDETDGARYVGSAYGHENLYGRWQAHTSGSLGVTANLKQRDPNRFRFSILQLLSPAATANEVVSVENSWKERLHTRVFGLNEN
ncbi:GIY-YIG nuclease family protein [Yoonia sp.]|uniref:GIY-YIG nuclease family protein n=1 Tax=Yoonia sp. TaxID=2212373 RepID=UPI002FDA73F2